MTAPGVKIGGELFPFPESVTLGDTILAQKLTGREFNSIAEGISGGKQDMSSIVAMMAIAVAHAHPDWPDDKVIDLIRSADVANLEFDDGDDASPPVAAEAISAGSSTASTISAAATPAASV